MNSPPSQMFLGLSRVPRENGRLHMNGLRPFERIIKQTAETNSPLPENNIREVKHEVYGKRQTANGKNETFAVCLHLSVQ